jgi:hypothetical protein
VGLHDVTIAFGLKRVNPSGEVVIAERFTAKRRLT